MRKPSCCFNTLRFKMYFPADKRVTKSEDRNFTCTVFTVHLFLMENEMEAQSNKDERIELRISSTDKMIFKRAQKLSGDKSFSSFIVRIVKKQAEEIVAKNDRIIATERDREVFFDAVFGDRKPNQHLIDAAIRFKSKLTSE